MSTQETNIEETEPECERCSNPQEDCECETCGGCEEQYHNVPTCDCVQCSNCDQWNDNCECTVCLNCDERFSDSVGGCSSCEYCWRCIRYRRVVHYSCLGCGRCQTEAEQYCAGCGQYECCADFTCREDECYRCTDCCSCEPEESQHIQGHSCRNYPDSIPAEAPRGFLYIGVECETEAGDSEETLRDAADAIHEKHSHEILMKEDGSLDCGVELVTGKYSLDAHKNLWPRLCATATKAGLRSWKHSTTGLHVHLTRRFFTQLEIGKFVVFLNSDAEDIKKNRRKLAGRDSNGYATIAKKTIVNGANDNSSRYEAVNLTNEHTIEVRIFKGTLNEKHILADIEFCHAVAYWVKQCSIQEAESWASFWAYVKKHRKDYKELINFFEPATLASITNTTEKENRPPCVKQS